MLLRKKLLPSGVVLSILLSSSLIVSVGAALIWSQAYGGFANDYAYSVVEASDGGFAIAGITHSFATGPFPNIYPDCWLVKTDALGSMQWNKTYGGERNEEARSIVATSDGGYAIAGATDSSVGLGHPDFWLVKTDALGNMQWNKTYGGYTFDRAYSLVATSDGGYALAGYTESFDPGRSSLLVKTDSLGNMEWNKTYGSPYFASAQAWSLVAASDGGYAMACEIATIDPYFTRACLVKTDASGNMVWNRTYGEPYIVHTVRSLSETSDGGYALAGLYESEFWLIKTDSNGVMEWNKTYGGTGAGCAFSLVQASDGGYVLAGSPDSEPPRNSLLVKTDAFGNMEWNKTYVDGNAYSLIATSDGGYSLAGYTQSFGAGGRDFWLVKTNELGVYPEYSSWLIPALVLTTTAFIITNKKRLLRKRSQKP
jgi:hypothetical protein